MSYSLSPYPALKPKPSIILFCIFVAAFLVRALFLFQWMDTIYGSQLFLDAEAYDKWARHIAAGHWLRSQAFYQSPLMPYFMALLYKLFGHSFWPIGFCDALFGGVTAALCAAIAWEYFGFIDGIVTGALAALYRPLVFYAAPPMKEELGLLLLAFFLFFVFCSLKSRKPWPLFICGLWLGLAALVRGNVLFLMPLPPIFLFFWARPVWVKNSLIFIGATLLFIAPATLHNALASHDFLPINYTYGYNLYIGNSPDADGSNHFPDGISANPGQEEKDTTRIAEEKSGHILKPSGVSGYWRDQAIHFIARHPREDAHLLWEKIRFFLSNTEAYDNYDIDFIVKTFPTLLNATLPEFCIILTLAVFGGVAAYRRNPRTVLVLTIMAIAYMVSVLLFYVTDRYRLPVVIFLLPLAGTALSGACDLVKQKKWPHLAVAFVLSGIFLAFSLWPLPKIIDLTAYDWGTICTLYADGQQETEARAAMGKALAAAPEHMGPQCLIKNSYIEEKYNNRDGARQLLELARRLYPRDDNVLYNIARLYALQGDFPHARDMLEQAAALAPGNVMYDALLAHVYLRLRDRQHAREALDKGFVIAPLDARLLQSQAEFDQVP